MNDSKKYYLGGINFQDLEWADVDKEAIFKTQLLPYEDIGKDFFEEILELQYLDNKLIRAIDHLQGTAYPIDLTEKSIELNFPKNISPKHYYTLYKSKDANYDFKLFGSKPDNFYIPTENKNYTVNYVGTVSKTVIDWLPLEKIDLFAPEFLVGTLFIDYSNPHKPKYLNEEVIQKANYPNPEKGFTIKYFKEEFLSVLESNVISDTIGNLGIPHWIQHPDIPRCPKSGRIMRFMLSIDFYEPCMLVFMEPTTSIVGILLQR